MTNQGGEQRRHDGASVPARARVRIRPAQESNAGDFLQLCRQLDRETAGHVHGSYRPGLDALAAVLTRIVIAVGEESRGTFTGRRSLATAARLGQQATVFPSHHGGFVGGDSPYAGQPEAFARTLRAVLTEDN